MDFKKTISAVAMSMMMLIALPSCDKDDNNETDGLVDPDNYTARNEAAIEAATISKKVAFPNFGSISQVL